jgi:hypothetical protein
VGNGIGLWLTIQLHLSDVSIGKLNRRGKLRGAAASLWPFAASQLAEPVNPSVNQYM